MRERRKKRKKSPWVLGTLLAAAMVLEGGLGLWLRAGAKEYADQPPMAVPFLWLQGAGSRKSEPVETPASEKPAGPAPKPTYLEETPTPTMPAETTEPTETQPIPEETRAPLAVYGQDESYFDDALFLGDSRMESLARYARLGNADYFTDVGMTVFRLFSERCYDDNFSATDLGTLLTERQYGKIYVMLGLNEAGYALDQLERCYADDLAELRRLQPGAKIYLLKIYGVSRGQAESASWLGPENLDKVNEKIQSLCDGENVVCLDPRGIYEDGEGYLREDCSDDGVHPYVKELEAFDRWLCENAGV